MHKIDIELIEMTLDVMKYAIGRISATDHLIGKPKKAEVQGNGQYTKAYIYFEPNV